MGARMSNRRSQRDNENSASNQNDDNEQLHEWSPDSNEAVEMEQDSNDDDEEAINWNQIVHRNITSDDLASTILAFILRNSRQMRLLDSGSSLGFVDINDGDIDDDSEDDENFRIGPMRPLSPQAEPCPDTSRVEGSRIHEEVAVANGNFLSQDTNIAKVIYQRQNNTLKRCRYSTSQLTQGDKVQCYDRYLPTTMKTMKHLRHKVFCGQYSVDGSVFLSACQDQHIRLFDTSNGKFQVFRDILAKDVGWSIVDTAYSPDQRYLIYSSWSDFIHLCNIYGDYETHVPLDLRPEDSRFCAFSICFSQDNTQILAGGSDKCIYLYDRGNDKRSLKICGHYDDVNTVKFANESSDILVSGSDDGLCMVWDRRELKERNPKPVGVFAGHTDGITDIDAKGDGRHLISNSKDQTIKLWDMRRFASKDSQRECRRVVSATNWDYRWESAPRRSRRLTRINGDPSIMTYRGHSVLQTLIRAKFSPLHTTGQRYIYTGCATGNIVIYDIITGKIERKLKGHKKCVRDISWHPFQQTIMSSSWDCTIGQWQFSRPVESDETEKQGKKKVKVGRWSVC